MITVVKAMLSDVPPCWSLHCIIVTAYFPLPWKCFWISVRFNLLQVYSIVHPCKEKAAIGKNKWSFRQPHSCLNWLWERAIIMWGFETAVVIKWPWNKVESYLGLWKSILTTPFSALIHAYFYFGESVKQKHTLWGLPISELAVPSKPLIRYGSMLAQQLWIKKKRKGKEKYKDLRELSEKTADTGHVWC